MTLNHDWLTKLKLDQLQRLAIKIGTPCSGTKPVRIQAIQHGINATRETAARKTPRQPLSVISIDMGVRNLAYCHLKTSWPTHESGTNRIEILQWKRLNMEASLPAQSQEELELGPGRLRTSSKLKAKSESYDPATYASRAHAFVTHILKSYRPTHVLIERQRFRSGGQAAVQEWSIRVGVFEAMLYAVFTTMMAEKHHSCQVVPILPQQVNRFWLESDPSPSTKTRTKATGKTEKLQKIGCVEKLLSEHVYHSNVHFFGQAEVMKEAFLSRNKKKTAYDAAAKLKLDDLSDSLLQGLAWIRWQNNRLRLDTLRDKAFDFG